MTPAPIHDLGQLLRELRPRLQAGRHAFVALPPGAPLPAATIGWFREAEGLTAILPLGDAEASGMPVAFECTMITLEVPSALEAVGLTAAVAGALATAGIACNVVAALHHDHLFVPADRALDALAVLKRLSADAGG